MNKYKKLAKNVSILTISNFGSKILSILLVPLYTSVLSTGDYGTFDLYQTTISLLLPILSLNIPEAVLRFALDKENDKRKVFTIGLQKEIFGSLILCILVLFNCIFNIIPIFNKFPVMFVAMFVLILLYSQLTQFAQGCEKIFHLAVAGIVYSVVMLASNLLMLLVFKMGLNGYFYSFCLANIIPIIYLFIALNAKSNIMFHCNDKALTKAMTSYSKPLMIGSLAWWLINVSDRYIVTFMCGVTANGIYSVSYKIPAILNAFQTIFNQAWTISAVNEFDDGNSEFFSKIYRLYNAFLIFICSALILTDKLISKILFAKEFFTAWKYAPFLLISILFGSLAAMLAGIFAAAKESKALTATTIYGTAINIVLNIILINKMGAIGAAIATMIAYFVIWLTRLISSKKIIKMCINLKRDMFAYILLLAQAICLVTISSSLISYGVQFAIICLITITYYNDIKETAQKMITKLKDRKSADNQQ